MEGNRKITTPVKRGARIFWPQWCSRKERTKKRYPPWKLLKNNLLSQWLTFWTFGDSIFSRLNKVQTVFSRVHWLSELTYPPENWWLLQMISPSFFKAWSQFSGEKTSFFIFGGWVVFLYFIPPFSPPTCCCFRGSVDRFADFLLGRKFTLSDQRSHSWLAGMTSPFLMTEIQYIDSIRGPHFPATAMWSLIPVRVRFFWNFAGWGY